jgi:hypothetical protein
MSVTMRVLLDPARMPTTTAWAAEIRTQGFAMDLDVDFDPKTFSGFLPCIHQGQPAGFEYFFEPDSELDDDVRRAAGTRRTLDVSFVTHSGMRELVSAMIASGVLALLSDGVVWSDEAGDSMSGVDAINLARETEGELGPVPNT